jgi:hypothetical protein
MFDLNQLFTKDTGGVPKAVTTNGDSDYVAIQKTGVGGVLVGLAVTAVSGTGTPTMTVKVQESDTTNSGYSDAAYFGAITTTGRWFRLVQSKKAYLRINYSSFGGTTPSFTTLAGIVSGPQRDWGA